jgi:hypothetical protein
MTVYEQMRVLNRRIDQIQREHMTLQRIANEQSSLIRALAEAVAVMQAEKIADGLDKKKTSLTIGNRERKPTRSRSHQRG